MRNLLDSGHSQNLKLLPQMPTARIQCSTARTLHQHICSCQCSPLRLTRILLLNAQLAGFRPLTESETAASNANSQNTVFYSTYTSSTHLQLSVFTFTAYSNLAVECATCWIPATHRI